MRSKYGMIGALIYLLIAGCTYAFSLSDKSMYSIAIFVLQGWPWVSFLPILLAILLNAVIIYFIWPGWSGCFPRSDVPSLEMAAL